MTGLHWHCTILSNDDDDATQSGKNHSSSQISDLGDHLLDVEDLNGLMHTLKPVHAHAGARGYGGKGPALALQPHIR